MNSYEKLTLKRIVRQRDGMKCVQCGMSNQEHIEKTGKILDVHRKVPGSPYTIDGCETLCRRCHGPKPKGPVGCNPRGVGVYLDEQLKWGVKMLAARNRRTISEEVEEAARYWLKQHGILVEGEKLREQQAEGGR